MPPKERDINIRSGIALKPQGDLPPRSFMKKRLPVGRRLNVEMIRRSVANLQFLDPLLLEPSERLEVLGENADRARFLAFEKIRVEVRQRRLRHDGQFITRC